MAQLEVIQIDHLAFADKKLKYEYCTSSYYDISISSTGIDGWITKLELKKFHSPITKRSESQLFAPHIENPIAFKCTKDGVDAGYMQLGFESWNKRMRIWELLVDSKIRKQGIGSLFIERAKAVASSAGARMIVLETQSCNYPAISFYLKQEFNLIGFDLASYSNEDQQNNEIRLEFGIHL